MNTRYIIPLLCIGALALACSTRVHSGNSSVKPTTAAMIGEMASGKHAKSNDPKVRLASSFGVHVEPRDVAFDFGVTNVGGKHVELAFPSGQAYDFVVVDSLGREVWRWSKGRMFTQTMRTKLLATTDAYRVDEKWDTPRMKGHYTAIALLNSTNYPVEERVDFDLK